MPSNTSIKPDMHKNIEQIEKVEYQNDNIVNSFKLVFICQILRHDTEYQVERIQSESILYPAHK